MSKTSTSALQNKNLILAAIFGFGGMLVAILASVAVVTPLVNAQVNSALALQATQQASLVASVQQAKPVHTVSADSCNAPAQNTHVKNEAPEVTVHGGGHGHGGGIYKTDLKMDWKKGHYLAGANHSFNTTTNTYTTNNTTTNNTSTVTKDSYNTATIGSHNTHTTNKTDVDITVKDSFNKDSYNTKVKTDITVKDSFNTTTNKDSYNTAVNSGNTYTDKSTTNNTKIETTVKDSFNVTDSGNTTVIKDNNVLSNNKVDVDMSTVKQTGLVNVNDVEVDAI